MTLIGGLSIRHADSACRDIASHSSSGPGHRPFTAGTGVRTPYGTPLRTCRRYSTSGNSSVVEHNLAKVGVASSNLVSRSMSTLLGQAKVAVTSWSRTEERRVGK